MAQTNRQKNRHKRHTQRPTGQRTGSHYFLSFPHSTLGATLILPGHIQAWPKKPGWGWLSCTQGNVMSKHLIPQFSGGWQAMGRGASLQCRATRSIWRWSCRAAQNVKPSSCFSAWHHIFWRNTHTQCYFKCRYDLIKLSLSSRYLLSLFIKVLYKILSGITIHQHVSNLPSILW